METLARIIESLPVWVFVLFAVFFLGVIADIIWTIIARKKIYDILALAADNPENARELAAPIFGKQYTFIRSQAIERFVKNEGNEVVYLTGIDQY